LTKKVADIYLAEQFKDPLPVRVEASAKSVAVPAERLAQYAGLYWKKDDEEARRIVVKDGKLFWAYSVDQRLELTALSENRFQLVVYPIVFTFDAQGLRMQAPDEEKADLFERVSGFAPTPAQLSAYAGSYVSEEIEPVYRVVVEKGGLVLKRLKSKPQKLEPTLEDYFQGMNGDIHFQRDAAGKISGFWLNSGRIQKFRFRKA
jgi:hypothetical protein